MANRDQLKNHLKNFTVKELKKEVMNVKKGFQVSKLKRVDLEDVILKNHQHFLHLLKKNKVKKTKPSIKKPKPWEKKPSEKKPNSTVKDIKLNKQQNDMLVKQYIIELLNKLDEKATGTRHPVFINDKHSGVTIQKSKPYIIRDIDNFSKILLKATTDRKKVEDVLCHMITQ